MIFCATLINQDKFIKVYTHTQVTFFFYLMDFHTCTYTESACTSVHARLDLLEFAFWFLCKYTIYNFIFVFCCCFSSNCRVVFSVSESINRFFSPFYIESPIWALDAGFAARRVKAKIKSKIDFIVEEDGENLDNATKVFPVSVMLFVTHTNLMKFYRPTTHTHTHTFPVHDL